MPGGFMFLFGPSQQIQHALDTAHVGKLIQTFATFEEGVAASNAS